MVCLLDRFDTLLSAHYVAFVSCVVVCVVYIPSCEFVCLEQLILIITSSAKEAFGRIQNSL